MSVRRRRGTLAGGAVMVLGVESDVLSAEEWRILSRVQPFGVVLVQRNVTELAALRALIAQVRAACPETLLTIDAEGGRVDRLRGLVGPAPAAEALAARPPALA
ncbi:MAG TPA: hypothetical protein VLA66_07725, partial [Thermoanaerobaculia bacterium]|nr:hypothetical protein [Thermoanaerobaculia bacterium]